MAMEVGADLRNMAEVWWFPATSLEGEIYDGKQVNRFVTERSLPYSCMINRYGDRFVNEAANYNDLGKAFSAFDATSYGYRNQPAWLLVDGLFRARYRLINLLPTDPDPDWLIREPTLADLAARLDIDAGRLAATISRFNEMADRGKDEDFGRGESIYDRSQGDPDRLENPNLGPINQPPFYAVRLYPGAVGTKGGPRMVTPAFSTCPASPSPACTPLAMRAAVSPGRLILAAAPRSRSRSCSDTSAGCTRRPPCQLRKASSSATPAVHTQARHVHDRG